MRFMGDDTVFPPTSNEKHPHESVQKDVSSDEDCSCQNQDNGSLFNGEEFGEFSSLNSLLSEAAQKQKVKVYCDVIKNYEELQSRSESLEEAKAKILSYKPGSWADNMGSLDLSECNLPGATTFLLIGPKGSGKSSLVNKISRVFDTGVFVSARAPVSCIELPTFCWVKFPLLIINRFMLWFLFACPGNSSPGNGTYFLYEYMIPRGSGSFCLYDTRGLSYDITENEKMLESWMKKGVRHGELIKRKSDTAELQACLKLRAKRSTPSSESRAVSYVVFVVNGISVLESMNTPDGNNADYLKMIALNYNNGILSFRNEKPVVVVTHGDLLPLRARARIRICLGNLLGISHAHQIFDVPESNDPATTMAIFDMLFYILDRADNQLCSVSHLKSEDSSVLKVARSIVLLFFVVVILIAAFLLMFDCDKPELQTDPSTLRIDWHKIRHLWLD